MPKLNPEMKEYIADKEVYRRYNIVPAGWRKVEAHEQTVATRETVQESRREKLKQCIVRASRKERSKKETAVVPTIPTMVIGPSLHRRAFTFLDGETIVLEREYKEWEFGPFVKTTPPKLVTPYLEPKQDVLCVEDDIPCLDLGPAVTEPMFEFRKDSVFDQCETWLGRLCFEDIAESDTQSLNAEVMGAGEFEAVSSIPNEKACQTVSAALSPATPHSTIFEGSTSAEPHVLQALFWWMLDSIEVSSADQSN
ncbi:hypothetical protein LTR37_001294 [Vermiconidia calcicola]|uniref:Uncharacterized protein n=1 Tax=Vermiconidia calcicola TaxID=1690605 RepID=A0ACC3NW35_9PEZI|nr:hypothetical protein LTR37_001294 [Vermiconidia calcicola]